MAYVALRDREIVVHENDGPAMVCLVVTGLTNVTERAIVLSAFTLDGSALSESCCISILRRPGFCLEV